MTSTETREARRPPAPHPEVEAEAEVDFGRYVAAAAARWWLLALGVLAGVAVGLALSAGGEQVFRAQALVYVGQPYVGNARVDTLAATPANVREIATSEAVVRRVAREAGMRPGDLRPRISVAPVTGGASRAQQAMYTISVTGEAPRRVADAANGIAAVVARRASRYADAKVAALEAQITAAEEELASLDRRIDALLQRADDSGLSATERLVASTNAGVLEQRRATVQQTRLDRQQQLELARAVEQASVVEPAVARRVTAQSRRNTIVVAGALGLLVGLVAALAWDPVAARRERRRPL